MKVWLFCVCRNERLLMPYFLRHYTPWVERLIFYDDKSDDGTRELIQECPQAILRDWMGSPGIVDDEFLTFANHYWREAYGHSDWIIWVDADEFLYHPNMGEVLQRYLDADINIPRIQGYTMVSKAFPTGNGQLCDEVKTGFPDDIWSKAALFRENIKWGLGRHEIDPWELKIRNSQEAEIKLLHYRALGPEYVRWRHARNWDRVPQRCRDLSYGTNTSPGWAGHHGLAWFEEMINRDWPNVI